MRLRAALSLRLRESASHARPLRQALIASTVFSLISVNAWAAPLAPGDGFDVERYTVALRPDMQTTAIAGSEKIRLRATADGVTHLAFSTNALQITRATLDGQRVEIASRGDATLFILSGPLAKGHKATLEFQFSGFPARGVSAVAAGIYTSYFACDWMICLQDAPGDKAHLALNLYLPAGVQSLGNGRALSATPMRDGLVLHRWRTTRPYSPYLYGFAAGAFARESVRTAHGDLVYLDASGDHRSLKSLFARAPAIAAFLADKAGMPLPDLRYAQLLAPGGEAQEAAGFALIGKTELDREQTDPTSAWIIVHEMAHQWWGNLVTCATWQDFWLHEGIATFMVAAWQEHLSGDAAYQRELDTARRRLNQARTAGYDKPLAWPGKYPSLSVRRAVQYSKGALFLAHLRTVLGEDAFWNGLRRFTKDHAGGTVTSKDFQNAMETTSRRDLSAVFAEWVYGQ